MIRILTSVDEMKQIKGSWTQLTDPLRNPLLSYDWFYSAVRAFYGEEDLRIVTYSAAGRIKAIAPLGLHTEHGHSKLELLGAPFLGEPGGMIYSDMHSLRTLIKGVLKQGTPISMRRLVAGSRSLMAIMGTCAHRSIYSPREGGGTPWIKIESDWEPYLQTLSSRRKSDLRRAQRRAETHGTVSTKIISVSVHEVEYLLNEVFRVEASSWKGRNGSSLLHRTDLARFFKLYCVQAADNGSLRIAFLSINGRAIAALLGLQAANRFWVFKIGYDETYARCSPGMLLMHSVIKHAFKQKLEAFEFLGWDAPWMHIWTDRVRRYTSPLIYPFSFTGLKGFTHDSLEYVKRTYLRQGTDD